MMMTSSPAFYQGKTAVGERLFLNTMWEISFLHGRPRVPPCPLSKCEH